MSAKSLKDRVAEQRDACKQRLDELRVEVAQNQEKIREHSQKMQELNQQNVLLANQMKGEEITLERLEKLAGEE